MPARSDVVSAVGPQEGDFRWTITVHDSRDESARNQLRHILSSLPDEGGAVQLWVLDADDEADALADQFNFTAYRDLWRLRASLPIAQITDLPTRAIRPDDHPAVLNVNRRAFAWHPEQGAISEQDFAERIAEPWFDPEGFLIHERDGRIAGFNWTRIHADEDPPLGEIYVIGTDPDFQGQGIGRGLAIAGLTYLADRGLETVILYVESDNHGANRLYEDLGFSLELVNRAYRLNLDPNGTE